MFRRKKSSQSPSSSPKGTPHSPVSSSPPSRPQGALPFTSYPLGQPLVRTTELELAARLSALAPLVILSHRTTSVFSSQASCAHHFTSSSASACSATTSTAACLRSTKDPTAEFVSKVSSLSYQLHSAIFHYASLPQTARQALNPEEIRTLPTSATATAKATSTAMEDVPAAASTAARNVPAAASTAARNVPAAASTAEHPPRGQDDSAHNEHADSTSLSLSDLDELLADLATTTQQLESAVAQQEPQKDKKYKKKKETEKRRKKEEAEEAEEAEKSELQHSLSESCTAVPGATLAGQPTDEAEALSELQQSPVPLLAAALQTLNRFVYMSMTSLEQCADQVLFIENYCESFYRLLRLSAVLEMWLNPMIRLRYQSQRPPLPELGGRSRRQIQDLARLFWANAMRGLFLRRAPRDALLLTSRRALASSSFTYCDEMSTARLDSLAGYLSLLFCAIADDCIAPQRGLLRLEQLRPLLENWHPQWRELIAPPVSVGSLSSVSASSSPSTAPAPAAAAPATSTATARATAAPTASPAAAPASSNWSDYALASSLFKLISRSLESTLGVVLGTATSPTVLPEPVLRKSAALLSAHYTLTDNLFDNRRVLARSRQILDRVQALQLLQLSPELASVVDHALLGNDCTRLLVSLPVALAGCQPNHPSSLAFAEDLCVLIGRHENVDRGMLRLELTTGLEALYRCWLTANWVDVQRELPAFESPAGVLAIVFVRTISQFYQLLAHFEQVLGAYGDPTAVALFLLEAWTAVFVAKLNAPVSLPQEAHQQEQQPDVGAPEPSVHAPARLLATALHLCLSKASWYVQLLAMRTSARLTPGAASGRVPSGDMSSELLSTIYGAAAWLDRVVDKTTLMRVYTRDLAFRLAAGLSWSVEREEEVIAMLRPHASISDLSVLTRMMDDLYTSNELNRSFKAPATVKDVGFHMLILNEALWPLRLETDFQSTQWRRSQWGGALGSLSPQVNGLHSMFAQHYRALCPGRTLNWMVEYSRAVLRCGSPANDAQQPAELRLRCTGPQLAVLLAMRAGETRRQVERRRRAVEAKMRPAEAAVSRAPPSLSLRQAGHHHLRDDDGESLDERSWLSAGQILAELQPRHSNEAPPAMSDVLVVLYSLLRGRIVSADPPLSLATSKLSDQHRFALNLNGFLTYFSSQNYGAATGAVPLHHLLPPNLAIQTRGSLIDRQLLMQAALVRLLKKEKQLDEELAVNRVIVLGGWHGQAVLVRRCLEVVIEKGFVRRLPDANVLCYTPEGHVAPAEPTNESPSSSTASSSST